MPGCPYYPADESNLRVGGELRQLRNQKAAPTKLFANSGDARSQNSQGCGDRKKKDQRAAGVQRGEFLRQRCQRLILRIEISREPNWQIDHACVSQRNAVTRNLILCFAPAESMISQVSLKNEPG